MVAERTLISEPGLNIYEHGVFVPGMGKNVKRLRTASLAQEDLSDNVYQRHCYITYGSLFYSIRFSHVYFYARRVKY